jgi:tRNA/rRNA methyltransferase
MGVLCGRVAAAREKSGRATKHPAETLILPSVNEAPGPRFVLLHTSHAGNVGAAARAIKVMGFAELVLVQPRFAEVLSMEETVAMAVGAADVLTRARWPPR